MHTGRYQHQSFWYWRLLSTSAEVSGFLEYQLHSKGTVLCFWSSLRYIKIWIVICYREIISPESNGSACAREWCCLYHFNLPLCNKKCFKYHPTKPEMIEKKICEGTDCLIGMTSLQVMVATARGVCCGRNEAVTLLYLVPWASTLTYRVI